jgi:hypothetical protein
MLFLSTCIDDALRGVWLVCKHPRLASPTPESSSCSLTLAWIVQKPRAVSQPNMHWFAGLGEASAGQGTKRPPNLSIMHTLGIFFLRITHYNADVHNTHAHSPLWTHVCKPYPYEHLRRTKPTDLEIHEVTTDALLSMGMLPTTESIAPLNSGINSEKYEHPCQIEDLNSGGQDLLQGT